VLHVLRVLCPAEHALSEALAECATVPRCRRLLEPAFARWQADDQLRAAIPVALAAEAADARALLAACRFAAAPHLVNELEDRVLAMEVAPLR
jgi:hypothetical protein